MQLTTKELEAAILQLSAEERMRLLESLLASLGPDAPIQDAWLELARARRDEARTGKVAMVPGGEAYARLRKRLHAGMALPGLTLDQGRGI